MKKKILVIGLMSVLALGACGKKDSAVIDDKGKEAVELRIYTWNQDPANNKREQEIFDEFTKDTGIKVKQVTGDFNKFNEKFMTMASGNDLPDLTWIWPTSFSKFVESDLLLPIDNYVKNDIDESKVIPGAMEYGKVNGIQYGMTRDLSTQNITYNKDMFDKAGIDYPKNDWTWADFEKAAEKLTIKEGDKTVQFAISSFNVPSALMSNAGSYITDITGETLTIDNPASIETIQFISDLTNKYNYQPTPEQVQGINNVFLAEKAAMHVGGVWEWKTFTENAKFNWDIVPYPQGNAGATSGANQQQIAITSQTKYPDESWELLKWLTYGRGQELQTEQLGAISALKEYSGDIVKADYAPDNVQSLIDSVNSGNVIQYIPYSDNFTEVEVEVTTEINNIVSKNLDAEKQLKELGKKLRDKYDLK